MKVKSSSPNCFFRPKHISCCKLDDELVLLDTLTGEYFSLNAYAATIYLLAGTDPESACAIPPSDINVSSEALTAIEQFLEQACSINALARAAQPLQIAAAGQDFSTTESEFRVLIENATANPTIKSWGSISQLTLASTGTMIT